MKYLPLYKKWMKTGYEHRFLCNEFRQDEIFDLFRPTSNELDEHVTASYFSSRYSWGGLCSDTKIGEFNSFRQTIVLFMAAMNGEL